ncbi:MAG: DUF6786 family protein [Planctomycetota bacterium]
MRSQSFLDLARRAGFLPILLGDPDAGIVILPDAEGRIFTLLADEVASRVVEPNFHARPPNTSLSLGGDVLWIAPEGTPFGFFYADGSWAIPSPLCALRFEIASRSDRSASLVSPPLFLSNNSGVGVRVRLRRDVTLLPACGCVSYETVETVEILDPPSAGPLRLVPWTLSQYPTAPDSSVSFNLPRASRRSSPAPLLPCSSSPLPGASFKHVYDSPRSDLRLSPAPARLATTGKRKFQLIFPPGVDSLTLQTPRLSVSRTFLSASVLSAGAPLPSSPVDISDEPPGAPGPFDFPSRMSVFTSDEGFLELEAVGVSPLDFPPSALLTLRTHTTSRLHPLP